MSITPFVLAFRKQCWPAALGAVVTLAGAACEDPVEVGDVEQPSFRARPDTVFPGDTFELVFTLRNPTSDTVAITSAYGCLFFLEVFRDQEPVSMDGAVYGCTAAIRSFKVPPGDSLHVVHALAAAQGFGAKTPLPPGTYRIRTKMNAALADHEAPVTVVDAVGGG